MVSSVEDTVFSLPSSSSDINSSIVCGSSSDSDSNISSCSGSGSKYC